MKVPPPPRRTLAAVPAIGATVGLASMAPLLLQGAMYRGIDQLALLIVLLVFGYGIWSAVQAFKSRPGWQKVLALFWLAQVPAVSSSFITFTMSCGAGAWLYLRLGPLGLGGGAAAYLGSAYQWSYMIHKPEVHVGVNVVAALLATCLLAGWRQAPAALANANAA